MTEIMPSLQNLIKLSYDSPAFRRDIYLHGFSAGRPPSYQNIRR